MRRPAVDTKQTTEHQCTGYKEGDWVIFICPLCNYQRHINCLTKAVVVKRGDLTAVHVGSHAPMVTQLSSFSIN